VETVFGSLMSRSLKESQAQTVLFDSCELTGSLRKKTQQSILVLLRNREIGADIDHVYFVFRAASNVAKIFDNALRDDRLA
jgi:hypothetical protein